MPLPTIGGVAEPILCERNMARSLVLSLCESLHVARKSWQRSCKMQEINAAMKGLRPDPRANRGLAGDCSSASRGSEPLLLFVGVGQSEKEGGLAAWLALTANRAEVGQDDVPSDRQTQATAL